MFTQKTTSIFTNTVVEQTNNWRKNKKKKQQHIFKSVMGTLSCQFGGLGEKRIKATLSLLKHKGVE